MLRTKPNGEPINGPGRPTKYHASYAVLAERFCRLGARDIELAHAFDVSVSTINNWKITQPRFAAALKVGKDVADSLVEAAMFAIATGYSFDSVKTHVSEGRLFEVPFVEHRPPDGQTGRWWLANRRPKEYSLAPVAQGAETQDLDAMIQADKMYYDARPDEPIPENPVY